MATFKQKLRISAESSLLFSLLNLPEVFQLQASGQAKACTSPHALVLHAALFFAATFATMAHPSLGTKVRRSLYGTLIFYLASSPAMYSVVGSVLGDGAGTLRDGCPTKLGVFVQAALFCAMLVGVMYIPAESASSV